MFYTAVRDQSVQCLCIAMPVCVHAIQQLLRIHFNSSTVHYTSVNFLRSLLSHLIEWRSETAGEVIDTSFSLFPCRLWFMCMVSALSRTSMLLYDDSLESLASEYWTAAWFIWLNAESKRGFSADPEPLQRLPDPSQLQTPHVVPVSSPNVPPFPWAHTHTRGQNKALPASPRYPFSLLTQSKCLSALFCGGKESADPGCLTLHMKRPPLALWKRDFVMGLCPLTHSAVPLRPSVSRPIHSSGGPGSLLSVYCGITAFVCF